jgi:hypothetical protein
MIHKNAHTKRGLKASKIKVLDLRIFGVRNLEIQCKIKDISEKMGNFPDYGLPEINNESIFISALKLFSLQIKLFLT